MGQFAAGRPMVGNDFIVPTRIMPVKPAVVNLPPQPQEMYIDESVLYSLVIADVAQTPKIFEAGKPFSFFKVLLMGVVMAAVAIIAWSFLSPLFSRSGVNLTQPVPAVVADLVSIHNQKVSFALADKTFTAAPADIEKWISNDISAEGQLIVNTEAVKAYLSELAAPYYKEVLNKIVTADGQVLAQGKDGAKLDTDGAYTQISNSLLSGQGMNFNLAIVPVVSQTLTPADIDKLILINTTTKRLYAYEYGKEIKSFLVTAGQKGAETPIGQFKVTHKIPLQDMAGITPNGTRYNQRDVKWVSYIIDEQNIAIHGNYWRPRSVFGNQNTSNGCVALPDEEAKWIYEWAPVGTIVITQT